MPLRALFLFFLLSPAFALSAGKPATAPLLALWDSTFAARPGNIDENFILRLLGEIPGCETPSAISRQVHAYRDLLKNPASRAEDVAVLGKNLENQARDLRDQAPSACRDLGLAAYAAESTALLTGFWEMKGGVDSSRDSETKIKFVSLEQSWIFTVIAAYRKQALQFRRESHDHVLGSYDCGLSQITVDPAQRPLDLGATIIHELTHYFFDKNSAYNAFATAPQVQPPESPSKTLRFVKRIWAFKQSPLPPEKFRTVLLVEEAMAALHAGYLEREFMEHIPKGSALTPDAIGDLNFFSSNGPLSGIDAQDIFEYQFRSGIDYRFHDIVALALLYNKDKLQIRVRQLQWDGSAKYQMPPPINERTLSKLRRTLYNRIAVSYFGRELTAAELDALEPRSLEKIFPTYWMPGYPYPRVSDILTSFHNLWMDYRIGTVIQGIGYQDTKDFAYLVVKAPDGSDVNLLPGAKLALLGFAPWAKEKSYLCRSFEAATVKPLLQDYLGVQLKPYCTEPVNPDNSCPDPTRPGTEGVRPGTEGVRPNGATRLCIEIGDKV